jgi:hypothetical protein
VVGGNGSEADVYVANPGGSWKLQQRIPAPADMTHANDFASWLGSYEYGGVTVSGNTLAVGGPLEGAVWVYTRTNSTWTEAKKLTGTPANTCCIVSGGFGSAVALGGSQLLVGAPSDGSGGEGVAYLFNVASGNWSPEATLQDPNAQVECARNGETAPCALAFGNQVALDGGTAVVAEDPLVAQSGGCASSGGATVGRCDDGAAYAFTQGSSPSSWSAQPTPLNSVPFPNPSDSFGSYLAVSRSRIVAGSNGVDISSTPCCASEPAYVFTPDSFGVWQPAEELQGPTVAPTQGNSIAPSGEVATNGSEEIVAPGVFDARVYP